MTEAAQELYRILLAHAKRDGTLDRRRITKASGAMLRAGFVPGEVHDLVVEAAEAGLIVADPRGRDKVYLLPEAAILGPEAATLG
jgi:hypothetical protein